MYDTRNYDFVVVHEEETEDGTFVIAVRPDEVYKWNPVVSTNTGRYEGSDTEVNQRTE